ncbi:hypothetical protein [Phycicoccus sonneratiae]|uniref:LppP/LprE lipoprotein n=1 Tax=Phycicoccus sonneratiae TaxID=2807628 RepID=A0ABS2CQN5_9MICO|nr:hypothetical protein [Phycicoccus sonneraticus]MBM6402197.1 hypothetical protein [Phycicoccus sonneraticus]
MRTRLTVTTALVALALAGCGITTAGSGGGESPSDQPSTVPTSPSPSGTAFPSTPPGTPPPVDDAIPPGLADRPAVKAALEDAAGRAGIVPETVEVAGYSHVTWADGSLGCPQKGMAYTQMTVEGELLRISAGQRVMEYHARLGGPFTYCANPSGGSTVDGG